MPNQSINSWVNKDSPSHASSMGKHKDGFEDILEDRRLYSDLKFSFKSQPHIPKYKYNQNRTPQDIKKHVLASDRVKYRIEMISKETGVATSELYKEAALILDEMSHNQSMHIMRSFCYFLVKALKSLFQRIYVNEDGVQRMRQLLKEYPVILMPTHRSYLDFLLVSYIFFNYDLTLPVIAAIMDFNGMLFFGWLLRNCGAFYIRRNFGSNLLYWAIFTEYVQTQLRNGDYPIEFFVEGTRSRTGKAYQPKIGMLSAALESYFKAEVPDVMLVPISISYERILEEQIYAYELLGIPKPKESASGVFKARSVLKEDFGSVHFFIGEAISIRQYTSPRIDRVFHGLEPRYINNLSSNEQMVTTDLAYTIVRQQQQRLIISPFALVATVMLQGATMNSGSTSLVPIPIKQLIREVDWIKRLAYNFGAYVDWPGNASSEAVLRHYLRLHSNICHVTPDDAIALNTVTKAQASAKGQSSTFINAATTVMLASYRNNIMHVFIRPAIVAMCVNGYSLNKPAQEKLTLDELYERYAFLQQILSCDFVFQPGETKKDFNQAVQSLSHCGGIYVQDNYVWLKKSTTKHTLFLSNMIEPFLLGYWLLCQYLISIPIDATGRSLAKKPKPLAYEAQRLAFTLVEDGTLKHLEVLSLDMLNNALMSFVRMKAIFKDKRVDEPYLSPNHSALSTLSQKIATFLDIPNECMTRLTKLSAKL